MNKFELIQNKIVGIDFLQRITSQWHITNKKFVFTNGCFDLLHRGHITYLLEAANLAHHFVVAINSDCSVKKLKGENRPIQDQKHRALLLANFAFVDYVVLFDDETPYELINKLQPDFLVKGGDYQEDEIVGADVVKKNGGEVLVIPLLEGFSTTDTIHHIQQLKG